MINEFHIVRDRPLTLKLTRGRDPRPHRAYRWVARDTHSALLGAPRVAREGHLAAVGHDRGDQEVPIRRVVATVSVIQLWAAPRSL